MFPAQSIQGLPLKLELSNGLDSLQPRKKMERRKLRVRGILQSHPWRLTGMLRAVKRVIFRSAPVRRIAKLAYWTLTRQLRRQLQLRKDLRLMQNSGLFNVDYYLSQCPDVAASGANPLVHYLNFGAKEGRNPHPKFSSLEYLKYYPDVRVAGCNPLLHFLEHGQKEGRIPFAAATNYGLTRECLPVTGAVAPILPSAKIAVIVPVYRSLDATRRCIESALRSSNRIPWRLIVINDASPEPEVVEYIRTLAGQPQVEVLHNETNQGFVRTVNRGMSHVPGHDVILLNSDAEVAHDWIDRMAVHAYASATVGTVTPFSNNATICSYPTMEGSPELPGGETVQTLDAAFHEANAGRSVAIPTAVGFCMYIRRDCLDQVGLFDAESYGQGYGEENDFCMRAAAAGWKHLLAGDTFVYHRGEVSFAGASAERKARATEVLTRAHPTYLPLVSSFVAADPIRPLRISAGIRRYRRDGLPVLLFITHNLGGGTKTHIRRLLASLRGKARVVILKPGEGRNAWLTDAYSEDQLRVQFDFVRDYDWLVEALRGMNLSRAHVHHTIGLALPLRELLLDVQIPFDFTAHDYFSICPQIHLRNKQVRYCGEPGVSGCNHCLLETPSSHAQNIIWWRIENSWLLTDAQRIICPSFDVARRLKRYAPTGTFRVVPHDDEFSDTKIRPTRAVSSDTPLRIALLGELAPHKGLPLVEDLVKLAAAHHAPLEFRLIGHTTVAGPTEQALSSPNFSQTGLFQPKDLPGLLEREQPHLIWLSSTCPETYSFTLSEAFRYHFPVVVPNLGALPERVTGRPWSWIVEWRWSAEQFLAFFSDIRRRHFITGQAPEPPNFPVVSDPGILFMPSAEFYEREYLRAAIPGTQDTRIRSAGPSNAKT